MRQKRRIVEFTSTEPVPTVRFVYSGVRFNFPEDIESLPLRIVIHTGKAYQRRVAGVWRRLDPLDKVQALPNTDDGARLGYLAVR
jgi:hypothetical protein